MTAIRLNCVLLSFALIAFQSVNCAFDPESICSLVMDGIKMKDPRACDTWIECLNGSPISGSCDEGYFYERESQSCLPADEVKCISSNPCAAIETGFAADPYSCNGYYYCREGQATLGECRAGYNYNPGLETCIRDYPCTIGMDPNSICNILPDGVFMKDSSNCNGWQMCWRGNVIIDTCSDTFYFDAAQSKCEYPQNVQCSHTEPPPQIADDETCPQSDIFVSDGKTCNGYYYCHENDAGEMLLLAGTCSEGRFFNAAQQGSCVPQEKLHCSYDRCVNRGQSHVELANVSDDGCRGYSICQDGVTIGIGICPADQPYFDELTQRCTSEIISYAACAKEVKDTTIEYSIRK
ncbi:peritrophin-48 [Drosophila nasuta]|uniref:peritrophin-48 n=1 Tax=Drosophila nasuta TaxID=42062 RepID=UPI00295E9A37|nr:peritrophin-48 [Drosophila nasuta]